MGKIKYTPWQFLAANTRIGGFLHRGHLLSTSTAFHQHQPSEQLPLSTRSRDELRKIVMSMTLNFDRHLEQGSSLSFFHRF